MPGSLWGAAARALAVATAVFALVPLNHWLQVTAPKLTRVHLVDVQIAYQAITIAMTGALIFGLRRLGSQGRFLGSGDLKTPANAIAVLGVKEGEAWYCVLRNFAFIATGVTSIVVYLQIARSSLGLSPHLLRAFVISLPFAATNAAVEEGLLRVALLEAIEGALTPSRAALLSGMLFGAAHYWGVPGGVPGVVMASFLGFVLARSVLETRGVLGAWFVHFLQDVVIFTLMFAMMLAGRTEA